MKNNKPDSFQYLFKLLIVFLCLVQVACSGEGKKTKKVDDPEEIVVVDINSINQSLLLTRETILPDSDPRCALGGVLVEVGVDANGNDVLEDGEVKDNQVVCSFNDGVVPSNTTVNYAKVLENPLALNVAVETTDQITVELDIDAEGYSSEAPLYIKVTDENDYFKNSIFSFYEFDSVINIPVESFELYEAQITSTELLIEFCNDLLCFFKPSGDKRILVDINVNPVFISATSSIEEINLTQMTGLSAQVELDLSFDASGFNSFQPLGIKVSGGSAFYSTTYEVSNLEEFDSIPLSSRSSSTPQMLIDELQVDFCRDRNCSGEKWQSIEIPVTIDIYAPVVNSVPEFDDIEISQTILESSTLTYNLNLTTEDPVENRTFTVIVYDPTGKYFDETWASKTGINSTFSFDLELYAIDAFETELHEFEIHSVVCLNSSCSRTYSEKPTVTNVDLTVLYPSASLELNEASLVLETKEESAVAGNITGIWSWQNLGDLPVYLVANEAGEESNIGSAYRLPLVNNFTLPIDVLPFEEEGIYSMLAELKLCLEPDCEHLIGELEELLPVELTVNNLSGWVNHQRNAKHNGFVPVTLDTANFMEIWSWQRTDGVDPWLGINPIAVENGTVVLTYDVRHSDALVLALSEENGEELWQFEFEAIPALNPPAIDKDKVWLSTTGHDDTFLHAFDLASGEKLISEPFELQWSSFYAPVPFAGSVFQAAGYYRGDLISFNSIDGSLNWHQYNVSSVDMRNPAVSGNYIVHHSGGGLRLLDRLSGKNEIFIDDNLIVNSGALHSYHGFPSVSDKYVVAFAGNGSSWGSGDVNTVDRHLSAFNIESQEHLWNSDDIYLTQPAIKDGVVYVGGKANGRVDAINLATGDVLWSWAPEDVEENQIVHNIIITNNLLFVATNQKVHAIDLSSRVSVWEYPDTGRLALSDGQVLYIATGFPSSYGELVAIDLNN